jgi:ankyrin repeat protein
LLYLGWTALHWTCFHGNFDALSLILKSAAKNDEKSGGNLSEKELCKIKASDGKTALQIAIEEAAHNKERGQNIMEALKAIME